MGRPSTSIITMSGCLLSLSTIAFIAAIGFARVIGPDPGTKEGATGISPTAAAAAGLDCAGPPDGGACGASAACVATVRASRSTAGGKYRILGSHGRTWRALRSRRRSGWLVIMDGSATGRDENRLRSDCPQSV